MRETTERIFSGIATGAAAKKLEQSLVACRENHRKKPYDIGCMTAMGLLECQLGRPANAEKWMLKSLTLAPQAHDVRYHYALVLLDQGKNAEAITALQQIVLAGAANADVWYYLGNALKRQGDEAGSEQALAEAIKIKPDHAGALNNLGNAVSRRGDLDAAIGYYERAIAAKPDYAFAFNNLGLALAAKGALDKAEDCYRRALELRKHYPESLNNLGIVRRMRGDLEESKKCYRRALELRPDYAEALNNLANALKDSGEVEAALAMYRRALALMDTPDTRHNMALALLALGQYDEGWREYESRWHGSQLGHTKRAFAQPVWRGEDAQGRTLLIHAEQGFGDTLQFCRYATMAAERGFTVILESQPALARLMRSLRGVTQVVARGEPLPAFDLHCPMMDLPRAFATQPDTIPAFASYLAADVDEIARWRDLMPRGQGEVLRVGLAWAGNPRVQSPELTAVDRRRSLSADALRPLLGVPQVEFYSLQKVGDAALADMGIIDFMPQCGDFADSAALIANLDLVISVDTSVAHLAAALGKPVWLLNRYDNCWRWFIGRDDSPWYPSLRQFRQPAPGQWAPVLAAMRAALDEKASMMMHHGHHA